MINHAFIRCKAVLLKRKDASMHEIWSKLLNQNTHNLICQMGDRLMNAPIIYTLY